MTGQCHEVQTVETALGRGNSWSKCPRQDWAQRAQGSRASGGDCQGQDGAGEAGQRQLLRRAFKSA